jgi:NADP-dependent 3-hydroxy acid dehydrogenase YdfG
VENVVGRVTITALLEADVVGHRYAREGRDLLSPQPGNTTMSGDVQPGLLGAHQPTAGLEERTEWIARLVDEGAPLGSTLGRRTFISGLFRVRCEREHVCDQSADRKALVIDGEQIMSTLVQDKLLKGRIAVVTGASSGIGEATAARLAELGAAVAPIARREDRLEGLADRVRQAGGTVLPLAVDVRDGEAVNEAAQRIADELGQVDLVVNNAGVQHVSPITDRRTDDWQHQIDLNVTGVTNIIGAFIEPLVAAASDGRAADLVNISSIAAIRGLEKFQVYSGTKAYIAQLTRVLHLELGPQNVRVHTVEPGMVDTELPDHVDDPDATKLMADLIDQIDVLSSEDIAETIAFITCLPRHVNLLEITALPTAQAI